MKALLSKFYMISFLCGFYAPALLLAGTVKITNENKKSVHIKIVPEGSSTENLNTPAYDIPAESFQVLNVKPSDINHKNFFSLKGHTNWAGVGSGTCEHLDVKKNYRVTLQNKMIGTTCIAREDLEEEE